MTNDYVKQIYGGRSVSNYPEQLAKYLAREYWKTGTLLDVGCGDKVFMDEFAKLGFECTGIDYPEVNFEKDKLPYKAASFDFIFCKSVIEHLANTNHFLKEIHRVLRPNGVAIILTPAWEYNFTDFYNDYTHIHPFEKKGLNDALVINQFKIKYIEYFYQLPFIWKRPWLTFVAKTIDILFGDSWKWKDKDQTQHRKLIRFSKEVMLLAVVIKTNPEDEYAR